MNLILILNHLFMTFSMPPMPVIFFINLPYNWHICGEVVLQIGSLVIHVEKLFGSGVGVPEWLSGMTRNHVGFACAGSNPAAHAFTFCLYIHLWKDAKKIKNKKFLQSQF